MRESVTHAARKTAISVSLDLLRAIAVLCVFMSHLLSALGIPNIDSLGRFGVVIFFVHTSFVLMASLERLDVYAKSDCRLIAAFCIRRFFRIYPLAILFVLLVPMFHIPASPGMIYAWVGVKDFLSNLALIQNLTFTADILGPLWSLPLEVQMYVILPFAYLIVRGDARYRSGALWAVAIPVALSRFRDSAGASTFSSTPLALSPASSPLTFSVTARSMPECFLPGSGRSASSLLLFSSARWTISAWETRSTAPGSSLSALASYTLTSMKAPAAAYHNSSSIGSPNTPTASISATSCSSG